MMKIFLLPFILFVSLFSDTVYVISNDPISTNEQEIKDFFSAKTDYLGAVKYKRISNQEAIEALANTAFSISKRKLSKKWIKQNFRKGTPFPTTLKNDAKTIAWIKNHQKTISFVTKKPNSVTIIYTFNE